MAVLFDCRPKNVYSNAAIWANWVKWGSNMTTATLEPAGFSITLPCNQCHPTLLSHCPVPMFRKSLSLVTGLKNIWLSCLSDPGWPLGQFSTRFRFFGKSVKSWKYQGRKNSSVNSGENQGNFCFFLEISFWFNLLFLREQILGCSSCQKKSLSEELKRLELKRPKVPK